MDSRLLPPIPTPPSQRWREVRLMYLPGALFVIAIIVIASMWSHTLAPSAIVAEAVVVGSDLRSPQGGVIASLKVGLHQRVIQGEVIGHVAPANPRLLGATLAVIQAEVGMINATLQGATDRQRVALEFERMQLDWMGHRVDRAALVGRLQQTDADLARTEPLFRAGLVPEETITQLRIARESLTRQLEEKNTLIARLEPVMLGSTVSADQAKGLSGESALAAAIKVQESKLRMAEEQLSPLPLIAPIDGVVSQVARRPGETVLEGDVILRITAPKPGRLVGYLMQPLRFEPKPGMAADIRTRGSPSRTAETSIVQIGVALEALSPTLLAAMRLPTFPLPETALQVEFLLPPGLELRPGEHVEISMR